MKYWTQYIPTPPPIKAFVLPTTREEAITRLGALEQIMLRERGNNRFPERRRNAVAEKMAIMTLLSTELKRKPTPRKVTTTRTLANEAPPYAGPRCGFCGGEAPDGRCTNESEEYPHPNGYEIG